MLGTEPGSQVSDFHSLPHDFGSVKSSHFRNVHLTLADYQGRRVDLFDTGLNFSVLSFSEDELSNI